MPHAPDRAGRPPRAGCAPMTGDGLLATSPHIDIPTYDRDSLVPSVVHISVGGFSRAHQLLYFDELAQRRISTNWGVIGIGLHSREMRDALAPQDYLYVVVERTAEQDRARVVGSLTDYLFAPDDPEAVLARLVDVRTRLITLTITGNGYRIDPQTGRFDPDDAEVQWDLRHPESPRGALGYLVAALDRRRRDGVPPFTVLSCDNLPSNGVATRTAVLGFARLRDEVLARWIADTVAFPSSMVDRITPHTTADERAAVATVIGVADHWPVITEPFSQWVVEDRFCNARPPLDHVGVRFVSDVAPYELMKKRLLNASHSALGYLGHLAGHRRTHEVMADPVFHGYVARLMDEEISPLLPLVAGVDFGDYRSTLLERFANPAIADRLVRLCSRGSTKMADYLLPSLHQAVQQHRPHTLLALAVAGWFRYLQRADPAEIQDPRGSELRALALSGGTDPRPLLAQRSLFGDLGRQPGVVEVVAGALRRFESDGVRETVADLVSGPFPTAGLTGGPSGETA
jgi:mannitol-1-phosphate/altronate dehydrogenase